MRKGYNEFKNGAKNILTDELVLPNQASKSDKYKCPNCKDAVDFAKGPIIPPYFRHGKKTECIYYTNESEDHLKAKYMLKDFLVNKKENTEFKVVRNCTACQKEFYFDFYNETDVVEDEFSFQHEGTNRRADIACISEDKSISCIYEICQTNATAVHARPEPWFEFDAQHVITTLASVGSTVTLKCKRSIFNTEKWDKCLDCETYTGKIHFNQRGAGCGKTYESIQLLQDKQFQNKTTFIYLTKMRSAKKVIEDELNAQFAQHKFPSEYELIPLSAEGKAQYSALVKDSGTTERAPRNIEVYIGTIDSFTYALRCKNFEGNAMFNQIVCDLVKGNIKIEKDGTVTYANAKPRVSEKCLVVIDEAQDLQREYILAFQEITKKTNMDTWVIGDRLQSILNEDNLFTYINALPENPQIIKNCSKNVVMRFHNTQLQSFVNDLVPFQKYDLPEIENICTLSCCGHEHENELQPWHVDFKMPNICDCNKDDFVNDYIRTLTDDMKQKVNKYGYLPNNFCFIFPIVSHTNQFITPLYAALSDFWDNIFNDDSMYTHQLIANMEKNNEYWGPKLEFKSADTCHYNHVIHHCSENRGTVDLSESEHATRIMSIHASKGQGCECVYFLGLSDGTLGCFSDHTVDDSLVFESMLHVGLTRCKKFVWVGVSGFKGQMKRFLKYAPDAVITPPILKFKTTTLELARALCQFDETNEHHLDLLNKYVDSSDFNKTYCENKSKIAIDWGHHIIRYAVMRSQISLMFKQQCISWGQAVHANFKEIINCKLVPCSKSEYNKVLFTLNKSIQHNIKKPKEKRDLFVPILCKSLRDAKYQEVSKIVMQLAESVQKKLQTKTIHFCPFEAIMHHHLTEMVNKPYNLTVHITDIYKLLSYSEEQHETYGCPCKKIQVMVLHTAVHDKINNHHATICQIEQLMQSFFSCTHTGQPNRNLVYKLNLSSYITNDPSNVSIEIQGNYDYYAESNEFAVCIYLKPQLNSLNANDLLGLIIVDRLMLQKQHPEKKIFVYILTLDYGEPILVEFKNTSTDELSVFVKNYLKKKFERLTTELVEFMDQTQQTWGEIETEFKLPYCITNYFGGKELDEGPYLPNMNDLPILNKRSQNIITKMF